MKIERIFVETAVGITVKHNWFQQDSNSDRLLVILPGRGYTLDSPAMHYLQSTGFSLGYDVLGLQYSFQYAGERATINQMGMEEIVDQLQKEVDDALRQALASKTYQTVCIAGKSLGTPLASTLINAIDVPEKRLILLTPVWTSVEDAGTTVPTLIIIGTSDGAFVLGQAESESRTNVTWKVYPDLNHGLEYADDWQNSITVLGDIIGICEAFLRQ
jgi:predicted alpha/beta-hydrolase family hydrolase